jgi:RNA-binding protein YhbY
MPRATLTALLLLLPLLAAPAGAEAPAFPKTEDDRKAFAETVCSEIDARAAEHALPQSFLARLIWKESLFDPGAVSPKGAQGIAQFMPGTAKLRGLADPFDPKQALAASAAYLAELRTLFGNLGRAAAAYNAGEKRVRRWLAGETGLPYETQDYVMAITGRSHEEWKVENASFEIPSIGKTGSFSEQCRSLVMRELSPQAVQLAQGPRKPWGVVLAGGFSEARALQAFRVIRNRYPQIKDEPPMITRKVNRSMGRRKMVRVMVGRDSRAEAQKLCKELTALGGACLVARN